jgi:hypothetical protein
MTEQAGKQRATSEFAEQKRAVLTVKVIWGCQAYNATTAEAARTVVADLYEQLSKGGTVTVHIEDADGKEYTHLVSAG